MDYRRPGAKDEAWRRATWQVKQAREWEEEKQRREIQERKQGSVACVVINSKKVYAAGISWSLSASRNIRNHCSQHLIACWWLFLNLEWFALCYAFFST